MKILMGVSMSVLFAAMAIQSDGKSSNYIMPELSKSEIGLCGGVLKKKINCPADLWQTTEPVNVS